jgi:ATP-dependent Lhr-like helicase
MGAFELLHQKVQSFIYKQKWSNFRPIQDQAIEHIVNRRGNLLICAPTASGKTEAAFLPIISTIADDFIGSYRVIYISPLKALINDQFKRMDLLCAEVAIPVTKWHGDVNQNIKTKSFKDPKGVLLITPESLEAMLLNKSELARKAFSKLQFVVVDEIHSFVGTERGAQLLSLLTRIEQEAGCKPVRVALSATIGNPKEVGKWLSGSDSFSEIQDEDWNDSAGIEGVIRGFTSKVPDEKEAEAETSLLSPGFLEAIYLGFLDGKNLIFGNSKRKLEETAYMVSQLAKNRNSNTQFLIHHGSLSKFTRETAEDEIKGSSKPTTVFCTSTLEMGIDIGATEKVGLIDPPWSVSGFAQRVGRSGRREGSSKKFEFFINEMEINKDSNIHELLRESLVKSIAIVQLYLEGFKEPLNVNKTHLSTMVHQTLSLCVQKTGASFDTIKDVILEKGFKDQIGESDFRLLLDHLIESKMLFLDERGVYSAGTLGEKFVEHFEFYTVFQTSDQWSIVNDGNLIGQIPIIGTYRENDHLLLGGRVWRVLQVVESAKRLVVTPSKSPRAPLFNSAFGITHERVHKTMQALYESKEDIPFLNTEARRLLSEARASYQDYLVGKHNDRTLIPIFKGSVIQNTISCLLDLAKVDHGITEVCLEVSDTSGQWLQKIRQVIANLDTPLKIVSQLPRSKKEIEKYDRFLPESLLNECYASGYLDLDGAKKWISLISSESDATKQVG